MSASSISWLNERRYPCGAERVPEGGVHFRVWAPQRHEVCLRIESGPDDAIPLRAEGNGYFSVHVPEAGPGTRYQFRLDNEPGLLADPASRYQPAGPYGPSEVIDPATFAWTDRPWPGARLVGQVLYELHVGTFTQEGTWQAAVTQLPRLAELGITLLEIMPVADLVGDFGWGYDGVCLFAPCRHYGTPDQMRAFVDKAHELGLGVILDVVYHYMGSKGNAWPHVVRKRARRAADHRVRE